MSSSGKTKSQHFLKGFLGIIPAFSDCRRKGGGKGTIAAGRRDLDSEIRISG
jgi:hypothetical protein